MITTIFGFEMDEDTLDYNLDVTEDENELTQCPEYRLREPYLHEGVLHPKGTLVHRSVHVQLKKNPLNAEASAAMFG